jgi:acetyltransferase-like isoleucine patch superfamily enzyme
MNATLKRLLRAFVDAAPPVWRGRLESWRSQHRLSLGSGTFVHPTVQILGRANVAIGRNSVVSEHSWLNVNHRHRLGRAIEIGDHCFIGRRNVFSSGASISLGDHVLTANDCHFLGSTHITSDPTRPVLTTGTSATDVISIGANTFIGAGVRIVGSVTIGDGCVVGAGALVTRDIPPFSQAVGSPAVVRKRYSFLRKSWVSTDEFDSLDAAAQPSHSDYLRQLAAHGPTRMPLMASGSDMGNC